MEQRPTKYGSMYSSIQAKGALHYPEPGLILPSLLITTYMHTSTKQKDTSYGVCEGAQL